MLISELARTNEEAREKFLGLSTLECARAVVTANPHIRVLGLRAYVYVPDTPTSNSDLIWPLDRISFLHHEDAEEFCANFTSSERPDKWNVALDSRISVEGGAWGHLPMLDLRIPKSEEALRKSIEEIEYRLRQEGFGTFPGFLLETGDSYHYLGSRVLTEEEWHKFNYLALTFSVVMENHRDGTPNTEKFSSTIVDSKYIGWSGQRGTAGLRLTTNGAKTFTPKVVAVV